MTEKNSKVVVIGLDGGTFNVIDPLIGSGKLPNLEKIVKQGVRGELLSTIPPVTGPAWASFMTGKSPDSHGLFDFVKPLQNHYRRRVVNYNDIQSKTIWSLLGENGKKLGIINVPVTYPPPKINGFLISGLLTPGTQSQFTYPATLRATLNEKFGDYILDVWWQQYGQNRVEKFIQDLIDCTVQRGKITLDLMKSTEWDFFMTVISGTDRMQHALWNYLFPADGSNQSNKDRRIRQKIVSYYQYIDRIIGDVCSAAGSDANLIMMSDHGFGCLKGKFYLNSWLEKIGLLSYDEKKIREFRLKSKIGPLFKQIVRTADPLNLRKKIMSNVRSNPGRMNAYHFLDCIDWSKTMAYAASNTEQGIYLNLAGREPRGIVEPGTQAEVVRKKILKELNNIVDPQGNEKLVSEIHKKEEIYPGPFMDNAPDIIFFFKGGQYLADVQPQKHLFKNISWSTGTGTHRMEGIFIAHGNEIRRGFRINGARIIDLAPTILNMMNVPVPTDMDGRILDEIFTDGYKARHPRQYSETKENGAVATDTDARYSEKESQMVEERLKALGYM